jgi:hypothetical protein
VNGPSRRRLREELGAAPGSSTQAVYRRLLGEQLPVTPPRH